MHSHDIVSRYISFLLYSITVNTESFLQPAVSETDLTKSIAGQVNGGQSVVLTDDLSHQRRCGFGEFIAGKHDVDERRIAQQGSTDGRGAVIGQLIETQVESEQCSVVRQCVRDRLSARRLIQSKSNK